MLRRRLASFALALSLGSSGCCMCLTRPCRQGTPCCPEPAIATPCCRNGGADAPVVVGAPAGPLAPGFPCCQNGNGHGGIIADASPFGSPLTEGPFLGSPDGAPMVGAPMVGSPMLENGHGTLPLVPSPGQRLTPTPQAPPIPYTP